MKAIDIRADWTYILDEHGEPVPELDIQAWSAWMKTQRARRSIGWNSYCNDAIRISTVFLAVPHCSADDGRWMLFETMVFADKAILQRLRDLSETDDRSILTRLFGGIDIQKRYQTRSEAEEGHKRMCEFLEVCLAQGLLTS